MTLLFTLLQYRAQSGAEGIVLGFISAITILIISGVSRGKKKATAKKEDAIGTYERSQMLYDNDNYYKWEGSADENNPYYRGKADNSELNRIDGYEVLYFINHFVGRTVPGVYEVLPLYQKAEKMIRYDVPSTIGTRKDIAYWIATNWEARSINN